MLVTRPIIAYLPSLKGTVSHVLLYGQIWINYFQGVRCGTPHYLFFSFFSSYLFKNELLFRVLLEWKIVLFSKFLDLRAIRDPVIIVVRLVLVNQSYSLYIAKCRHSFLLALLIVIIVVAKTIIWSQSQNRR